MTETYYLDTLNLLDASRSYAKAVARRLTSQGETDEAAMKALAAVDAIDAVRKEIELKHAAGVEV